MTLRSRTLVPEALRMLPGVSLPLERYVPEGGCPFQNGESVPQGAIVGVNPYLVRRHKSVWGADAGKFHPERWLKNDDGGRDGGTVRR